MLRHGLLSAEDRANSLRLQRRKQAGQRNSDGRARHAKYGLGMSRAEASLRGCHMLGFRYSPAAGNNGLTDARAMFPGSLVVVVTGSPDRVVYICDVRSE